MKQNIFLMLALVLTLASCGGSKSSALTNSSTSEIQPYINLDDLIAALDQQVVVCGEAGLACPGFVAKLTFWGKGTRTPYYLGVCSGTLYNNKYIITNSHCIPQEISKAGASCSNQLKVLFPKTKYFDKESAKCKSIVQVYNPQLEQPDLAVIELDRSVARDSVEIAKDAFIENANTTAFTMNPDKDDNTLGVIVKKTCSLSTDNAFFMSTDHSAAAAMISGSACEVIEGNSGSALLNKNGKMIGAVFAKMEQEELVKLFEKNKINYTAKVPMGIVQNISCLASITTNSGVTCNLGSPRIDDFNDFVERAIDTQGFRAVPEGQIEYEVIAGFKLKLKQVGMAQAPKDLQSLRDNWTNLFFKHSSVSETSKNLRSMTRK